MEVNRDYSFYLDSNSRNLASQPKTTETENNKDKFLVSSEPNTNEALQGTNIEITKYHKTENKVKSPKNILKALGIYRKSNLLDEVLKMYKRAAGNYSVHYGQDQGQFFDRRYKENYVDSFGNPIDHSTIADSRTKVTSAGARDIKSPQPQHKRLCSPPSIDSNRINFGVTNGKYSKKYY